MLTLIYLWKKHGWVDDYDEAEDDIDGHVEHDICTHNKYTPTSSIT